VRIVLVTGKGGVGKTTTSAATALRLADRGVRTLVLSTDSAHSLGDTLGVALTDAPTDVAPNLQAVQVDTQRRFEAAWLGVQEWLGGLLAGGGVAPIIAEELTVLPGIEEVLALLAVRDHAASGAWDALVLDCAPTAETLRLLALPEALRWYLDRVFPVQRRLARSIRPLAMLLGRGEAIPPDEVFDALVTLADDLGEVRLLLGDPSVTTVRLVLTPEAVVTAEARRTFTALALYGYEVDLVVANRVIPAGDDPWRQAWAATQAEQLQTVRESFGAVPVRAVPYWAGEPVGPDALREVADTLYGDGPALDTGAPASGPPLVVEPDGDGHLLRMRLPLAERGEVHAVRAGDELVVTVGGHRRIVALPLTLRASLVAGGSYRDGELRVRFRPDPERAPRRPRPRPRRSEAADG